MLPWDTERQFIRLMPTKKTCEPQIYPRRSRLHHTRAVGKVDGLRCRHRPTIRGELAAGAGRHRCRYRAVCVARDQKRALESAYVKGLANQLPSGDGHLDFDSLIAKDDEKMNDMSACAPQQPRRLCRNCGRAIRRVFCHATFGQHAAARYSHQRMFK